MKIRFYNVDIAALDLDTWPEVDEQQLAGKKKDLYRRRRCAMVTFVKSGGDSRAAAAAGGFSRQEVGRLFRRCTGRHVDGRLVGFRGCISWHHVKPYQRTSGSRSGTAGIFQQLFREYPEIERRLTHFALRTDED